MATLNLSSLQALAFHRLSSSFPQSTPTLSFNFQPKPFANPRPISLKPYVSEKPRARVVALAVKSLGETEAVAVSPEDGQSAGELPSGSGVYAVYDTNGDVQFIGLSRNIAASVAAHWKSVPELCGSVKVRAFWFYLVLVSEKKNYCLENDSFCVVQPWVVGLLIFLKLKFTTLC